jgi:hypothetical protein
LVVADLVVADFVVTDLATGNGNRRGIAQQAAGNIPITPVTANEDRRSPPSRSAGNADPCNSSLRKKYYDTARGLKTPVGAATTKLELLLLDQERESRESPMLNAFCRVAPSDRRSFLAILPAGVFLRAIVFRSRSSPAVHARRFFGLLAIKPPFQQRQFVSLTGVDEK